MIPIDEKDDRLIPLANGDKNCDLIHEPVEIILLYRMQVKNELQKTL